jgi:uncharacterized protein (UPF0335 family)
MMDEGSKKRLQALFDAYLDLLENRKDINDQIKDIVEEASEISGKKKGLVRKVFSFLKKKVEDGDDELDDITELAVDMEN